jgi:hypothetical protein
MTYQEALQKRLFGEQAFDPSVEPSGEMDPNRPARELRLMEGMDPNEFSYSSLDPTGMVLQMTGKDGKTFYLQQPKAMQGGLSALAGYDRTWNPDAAAALDQAAYDEYMKGVDVSGGDGAQYTTNRLSPDAAQALTASDANVGRRFRDQWDATTGTWNEGARRGNYGQDSVVMTNYNPLSFNKDKVVSDDKDFGGVYDYTKPRGPVLIDYITDMVPSAIAAYVGVPLGTELLGGAEAVTAAIKAGEMASWMPAAVGNTAMGGLTAFGQSDGDLGAAFKGAATSGLSAMAGGVTGDWLKGLKLPEWAIKGGKGLASGLVRSALTGRDFDPLAIGVQGIASELGIPPEMASIVYKAAQQRRG